MKRTMIALALAGLALAPLGAEMNHEDAYCRLHCSAEAVKVQIENLKKEYGAAGKSGAKAIEVDRKKTELKRHIAQHEAELKALETSLDNIGR